MILTLHNFVLQGSALPSFTSVNMSNVSHSCRVATHNLFNSSDACTRAVQEFSSDPGSAIGVLLMDNCLVRLHEYVNDCGLDDDDEVSEQSISLMFCCYHCKLYTANKLLG